jgi:hypothetical protein
VSERALAHTPIPGHLRLNCVTPNYFKSRETRV